MFSHMLYFYNHRLVLLLHWHVMYDVRCSFKINVTWFHEIFSLRCSGLNINYHVILFVAKKIMLMIYFRSHELIGISCNYNNINLQTIGISISFCGIYVCARVCVHMQLHFLFLLLIYHVRNLCWGKIKSSHEWIMISHQSTISHFQHSMLH